MRVACGYTSLQPATIRSLAAYAPMAVMADVSGARDSYWQFLVSEWGAADDLVTVEHDIEIHGGVLPGFADCDQPWCVFGYLVGCPAEVFYTGLGCTKLSAQARREVPLAALPPEQRSWIYLDGHISGALQQARLSPHVHEPRVAHHREYRLPGQPFSQPAPALPEPPGPPAVRAAGGPRAMLAGSPDAAVHVARGLGSTSGHAEPLYAMTSAAEGVPACPLPRGPALIQGAGWFTGSAEALVRVCAGPAATGTFTAGASNVAFTFSVLNGDPASGRLHWGAALYRMEPVAASEVRPFLGYRAPGVPVVTLSNLSAWSLSA